MSETLIQRAKEILNKNHRKEGFTIPSEGLYPFQWKWDSGFIALGWAHFDMEKAKMEIRTLLDAQWGNGFIPHIIFHSESETYFPGPDFHKSELHPQASKKYRSTGMTQPPVFGFILEHLLKIAKDKDDMLAFIKRHIDKVFDNHVYFYENRDINDEGLAYIYHNWESGTDNSPIWDDIWETMDSPEYSFERRDTTHVDPAQRPSKREYDHYLHLIDIAKKYGYNDDGVSKNSPFLVQDPLFNGILIKSNASLIKLYGQLGSSKDKIEYLEKKQEKSIRALNAKLFNEQLGAYVHYDLRNDRQLPYLSSSSFAPLFSEAPTYDMAKKMVAVLDRNFAGNDQYLCASFDPNHKRFNPRKYWRGPVWINLNWILYQGLKMHGFDEMANRAKGDTLALIEKFGFHEYFDSRKNDPDADTGYGGNNFSWSAALFIDLILENN